jgi:hypothetical protein
MPHTSPFYMLFALTMILYPILKWVAHTDWEIVRKAHTGFFKYF